MDSCRQRISAMQFENELLIRLGRMESKLDLLSRQPAVKECYTVEEFASLVDRAPFTVREWCRLGRINAEKTDCGRGNTEEWKTSHEELPRYLSHGLLPPRK